MTIREWKTEHPKGHLVRLEHDYWPGGVRLFVDGALIFERGRKLWDEGLEYRFRIEETPCIVRIIANAVHFNYELWADGRLQ